MSSLGGFLKEVVTYENLHEDHYGSKFFSLHYSDCWGPWVNADAVFSKIQLKVNCKKKIPVLPIEKYLFLVQARDTIMLHCLIMHFSLHYRSSGGLREVENKRKKRPQPLTFTSGGRLQEVQNIVIWLRNFWYVGKLVAVERQSLTRGCRHQRFNSLFSDPIPHLGSKNWEEVSL